MHNIIAGVESIGVYYGLLGDNLPEPSDVISLYQSNGIDAMRLYNPDSNVFNALKGTNISLMVGVPNEVLESFAYNASAAADWVQNNIVAYNGVNFKYCY
jgi:Glycosyl hydrolases family 17